MTKDVSVVSAVRAELSRLKATTTPEGRAVLAIATRLDGAEQSTAAALSRELRVSLAALRAANAKPATDSLDELKARRGARRAG